MSDCALPTGTAAPARSLPKVRIGLPWHSMNSDNLGVGALTLAHIQLLRAAAAGAGLAPEFVILGWKDPRTHYAARADIVVAELRMRDFLRPVGGLYSRLRDCDIVIDIGAGDSFADIYGAKRFLTVLGSKVLTLLARRPLLLAPQTIGPFARGWARRSALAVVRRAGAVATRDDLSTGFLHAIGYRGTIIEASDVALRLDYEKPAPRAGGPLRVGLNVSGLLFNGGYDRANMFGLKAPYDEVIRVLLRWLLDREGIEVHLVGHVISDWIEVEDDHRANLRLAKEFPGVVLAPKFADPVAAKSYIAGMDFFAGARMHACIAALSSGVPVLPMAYSRKFAGLFGSIGYDLVADCREDTADEILAKFADALTRRAALKAQAEASLARGLDRLARYEAAVRESLGRIAARRG